MGPVDTPDNLRHVRPQHNTTISPHTPVQPTPRMGPVSTPDNLRHVRPDFHLVVLVVKPKSGKVLKDITLLLNPATLICLPTARRTATYLSFILADSNLCGVDYSASLIQASFQEREAELAQDNNSENCTSGSESDQSNMSAPCSLSVPGLRERRPRKEPEPFGSTKKSRHASQVVLGLGSPNVSTSSTPSQPQQVPCVPTPASSLGENDFTTMTDEQM
ncbi:hypothetical protein L3X38_033957 [Prunus dulcis]|uniref:Uncharacterized protein n=1 Tax=Prunus dulcis TaxID=3755 RepID=A0AAD4VGW5_PRUDU|nr:hypothetical protein L3X38_033957 [Prunus dulcis]